MAFKVIIPVRYESKRLPGKALMDIVKKSMIQRVYEKCIQSGADSVVIATDDERIKKAAEKFGAPVCMTSTSHASGTERLAEAVAMLGYDEDEVVVNVQGNEPLIPPEVIHQVANNLLKHDSIKIATLCEKIRKPKNLFNPLNVKVVINKRGHAIYFSRAPIAWDEKHFPLSEDTKELPCEHYRHIGLYAYRVGFLQEYISWDPSPLEKVEKLEQLRAIYYGTRIHVAVAKKNIPMDVNTEEDLKRIRAQISAKKS